MRYVDGPYLDDLEVGQHVESAPTVLDSGVAAVHQGILGNLSQLALDPGLSKRVTGGGRMAAPHLVWDVSIGHSTVFTREVVANLFYRGLSFHRYPELGDQLRTRTTVLGLKLNSAQTGRPRRGLALLGITTVDQQGRVVLDYQRCAMLPTREGGSLARLSSTMDEVAAPSAPEIPYGTWDLSAWPTRNDVREGETVAAPAHVVSNAPELARLTQNRARVHQDARVSGQRLVYGGHTIGLALSQAHEALPALVVPTAWESCDHTAPVHEGDTIRSEHTVGSMTHLSATASVAQIVTTAYATDAEKAGESVVLDWRWTALLAR